MDAGVTSISRYSRTREGLRSDARYKAMPRDAREPAFKQYTAELQVCGRPASTSSMSKQYTDGRDCPCVTLHARVSTAAQWSACTNECLHNNRCRLSSQIPGCLPHMHEASGWMFVKSNIVGLLGCIRLPCHTCM